MLYGAAQALKAAGVDFVVAPYEADAQMAYLALSGKVHAVRSPCCSPRAFSTTSGRKLRVLVWDTVLPCASHGWIESFTC